MTKTKSEKISKQKINKEQIFQILKAKLDEIERAEFHGSLDFSLTYNGKLRRFDCNKRETFLTEDK